jgi:hypothetical protein
MKHTSRQKKKTVHAVHKPLNEFYTEDQQKEEHYEKKRKAHEEIEMQIFEHLKEHTKKILKK